MIHGEKVRITATSEPEARAKAYRLQDEARARAEQWPAIRERLKWPPEYECLEAAEGEGPAMLTCTIWRELVAKHLGLCDGDEWASLDLSRPSRIDLQALSDYEAFFLKRSTELAAKHIATAIGSLPLTLSAASESVSEALRGSTTPLASADRDAIVRLLAAVDEHAPDLMDAHVRQSGRSTVSLTREHPTVRVTMDRYLDDFRGRIGQEENGVSAETYNATSKRLHHALGLSAGKADSFTHAPPINIEADLHTLGKVELQKLVRFWLDGKVKRRTAVNRLRGFAAMLTWASKETHISYMWANGSRDLFKFGGRKGAARREARIDPYRKDVMVRLMKAARPRTKLYVLLSLNCGINPRDIAKLRPEHLRTFEDGRVYVVRVRSKEETSDEAYETAHVLWPETLALLQAQRAPINPHGLLLLTRSGTPLEIAEVDEWNKNPISKAFDRMVEAAKLKADPHRPQLRQMRKMGASAVFRHSDERTSAMYQGQAFEGSASLYITVSNWSPLTKALDEWAKELRADGVLS